MTEAKGASYPRRDADGRLATLGDLLGMTLAAFVVGLLAVLVFDVGFALLGLAEFGRASGWLAVVIPAWLFVEEFRATAYGAIRVAVAVVGAGVAVTSGLLAAGLAEPLPPLFRGAAGALTLAVLYALIWFHGVRWLEDSRR